MNLVSVTPIISLYVSFVGCMLNSLKEMKRKITLLNWSLTLSLVIKVSVRLLMKDAFGIREHLKKILKFMEKKEIVKVILTIVKYGITLLLGYFSSDVVSEIL